MPRAVYEVPVTGGDPVRVFGFDRPILVVLGAAESSFPEPQDLWDLMWSSIGQAQVLATPLQMAMVAGAELVLGKSLPNLENADDLLSDIARALRKAEKTRS